MDPLTPELGLIWPFLTRSRARSSAMCIVEDAGDTCRLALLRLDADGALRVESVRSEGTPREALSSAAALPLGRGPRTVLVVTAQARQRVLDGALDGSGPRRLQLDLPAAARQAWMRAAGAEGLAVARFYPFLGSALAGVRLEREPHLLLQVERRTLCVIECLGATCRDIAHHDCERPTLERCRAVIGEACPLVLLAGGGANLSELGYGLASEGSSWVRLAPLLAQVACDASPWSLAAVVGAARHAAGMAAADAVSWLPAAAPAGA